MVAPYSVLLCDHGFITLFLCETKVRLARYIIVCVFACSRFRDYASDIAIVYVLRYGFYYESVRFPNWTQPSIHNGAKISFIDSLLV